MHIGHELIHEIVETIWASTLGLTVRPCDQVALPTSNTGFQTGCVQITGAWEGAITLSCAEELARRAAALMFSMPLDEVTTEHVHDALGELANITGGNLKAFFPEPSYLSLPAVVDGTDYAFRVLASRILARATFECQDSPFQVVVVERVDSDDGEVQPVLRAHLLMK
jgi:chemotaxis protein CheX